MEDVKLVMTDGIATYWVTNFLPSFARLYPDLQVRLFAANDTVQSRGAHFDLSIQYITPTDSSMVAARLGTLHFVPYASPAYLKEYGTPRTLADLKDHRLLDFVLYLIDKGSWSTRLPDTIGEDRTMLYSNTSAMLCEAVRRGNGIALLPTYASLFERDLVALEELGLNFPTQFWVCYPEAAIRKESTQIMLRLLKHIFSKRMPWFADRYVPPSKFPETTVDGIMRAFSGEGPKMVHGAGE
jgi:DNA-binding transcriptional LysR family regulator